MLQFAWKESFPIDTGLKDTLLEFEFDPEQELSPTVRLSDAFFDLPRAERLQVHIVV
jgi:hypothetical protein